MVQVSAESDTEVQTVGVKALDYAITYGSIVFWAIVLWWAWTQEMGRPQFAVVFLGAILLLYVFTEAKESLIDKDYLDLLLLFAIGAVLTVITWYIFTNYQEFYITRQGFALDHEYQLAWLAVAVILYLTWRSYGNVFLILVGGTMLYALYGNHVPGLFGHAGINTTFMLQMLITDLAGFYGSLTQLTAAWIAPFLLYAGLLFAYGAFDLILRVAIVSAKYVKSGVAQTAVIASAVIGSINGSKAANAGMTGSFTIPTMMDAGLSGQTAAGTEGTASTLGQVLPPVMGASAFVMASALGIAYVDVLIAGLFPAAIVFFCVLLGVHYTSINEIGEQSMDFEEYFDERMTRSEKVVEGTRFGVPFFVLIFTLGYLQWTVMTSAMYTVVTMILLGVTTPVLQQGYETARGYRPVSGREESIDRSRSEALVELDGIWTAEWWSRGTVRPAIRPLGRLPIVRTLLAWLRGIRRRPRVDYVVTIFARGGGTFFAEVKNTVAGFRRGAVILAPIAIILAAVNGVVDLLGTTGMPSRIAIMLMELSGGILLIAVIFGMGVCIVMGIGMPTVAAYVIVSTLVAPTFIEVFEVPELAAHYMVFYASVLAGVTPPVAVSVVIAAGIAGSNFWRSCGTAITLAAPLFVLPIVFIYQPVLVSTSLDMQTTITAALVMIGAISIIYGLNFPFRLRRLYRLPLRFGLFWLGAFVMVYPEWAFKAIGGAIFVAVFLLERNLSDREVGATASPTSDD